MALIDGPKPPVPVAVPKPLADLLADPTFARSLPKPLCAQVIGLLFARCLEPEPAAPEPSPPDEPPIGLKEAGPRLGYPPGTWKKIWRQERFKKLRVPSATSHSLWSPAAIRDFNKGSGR